MSNDVFRIFKKSENVRFRSEGNDVLAYCVSRRSLCFLTIFQYAIWTIFDKLKTAEDLSQATGLSEYECFEIIEKFRKEGLIEPT